MDLSAYIDFQIVSYEMTEVDRGIAVVELDLWNNWLGCTGGGDSYVIMRYEVEFYVEDGHAFYSDIPSDVDVELRHHDTFDKIAASTKGRKDINPLTVMNHDIICSDLDVRE